MITVIATGFDGGKKRQTARQEATAVMDSTAARPARERDFLEELQRQRDEVAEGYGQGRRDESAAATVAVPRVERSVGEPAAARHPAPAYDAEDLEIPSFLRRK